MARPLGIEYEGAACHITSRGNARQDIFLDDEDQLKFFEVLEDVIEQFYLTECIATNPRPAILRDGDPPSGW